MCGRAADGDYAIRWPDKVGLSSTTRTVGRVLWHSNLAADRRMHLIERNPRCDLA